VVNEIIIPGNRPNEKNSDEKFCHACGRIMNIDANHCPDCGAPQNLASEPTKTLIESVETRDTKIAGANQVYCGGCGKIIHSTAINCPHCGAQKFSTGSQTSSKDKTVAGLFAILLGGLGVHHFYLGNVLLGIIYLVFCWTFIPMIVGFIEGIVYLSQSDESFARKYP
jgi:TM2 domain-containing membrane protein YozV/RNA polymerase subunit RPABC4/transcription elongation factor Spt4